MIYGIGCDIIELSRIDRAVNGPHGDSFIRRVLTAAERQHYELKSSGRRRLEFAAGRFAAKEAVSKALGCGISGVLGWHDIEIVPDETGKPCCHITERSRQALRIERGLVIHLSISHSTDYVTAYAVAELRM